MAARRMPQSAAEPANKPKGRAKMGRLNLNVSNEVRMLLTWLQQSTGVATLTDVIVNSIRLYEWLVKQHAAGAVIMVKRPNEDARVVEFFFPGVGQNTGQSVGVADRTGSSVLHGEPARLMAG